MSALGHFINETVIMDPCVWLFSLHITSVRYARAVLQTRTVVLLLSTTPLRVHSPTEGGHLGQGPGWGR